MNYGIAQSVTQAQGTRLEEQAAGEIQPKNITPQEPRESTNYGGSLLRLFQSEMFDVHMHMYYLHKCASQRGVQDYLVNQLYAHANWVELDAYLPQLSLLAISRLAEDSSSIHSFLLDLAAADLALGTKMHWWFQSVVEDKPKSTADKDVLIHNAAMELWQASEMAVVNGTTRSIFRKVVSSEPSWGNRNSRFDKLHGLASSNIESSMQSLHRSHSDSELGSLAAAVVLGSPSRDKLTVPLEEIEEAGADENEEEELEVKEEVAVTPHHTEDPSILRQRSCSCTPDVANTLRLESPASPSLAESQAMSGLLRKNSSNLADSLDHLKDLSSNTRRLVAPALNSMGTVAVYKDIGDPCTATLYSATAGADQETDTGLFLLKQRRCEFFQLESNFVQTLTRLSLLLPGHPDRKRCLKAASYQINQWLLERRLAVILSRRAACHATAYQTGGKSSGEAGRTEDEDSVFRFSAPSLPVLYSAEAPDRVQVLKIHVEDCKVYRTKTRAPYMLTLEVGDFDELVHAKGVNAAAECVLREMEQSKKVEDGLLELSRGKSAREQLRQVVAMISPATWAAISYPDIPLHGSGASPSSSHPPLLPSPEEVEARHEDLPEPPPRRTSGGHENEVEGATGEAPRSRKQREKAAEEMKRRIWGELLFEKVQRLREASPYQAMHSSWGVMQVMIKGGDDVRQEVLASQLVSAFKRIFDDARLPLWLRPYEVVVTSADSGLMELVPDTVSIDGLKKTQGCEGKSLAEIFELAFNGNSQKYHFAKMNFVQSFAAYCLVSYFLQVRDRHNGNLLLDSDGHLIHIDFGFMLSNSPGLIAFENSPFKLTQEYIDVMGGEDTPLFEYFRTLFVRGFLEIRQPKHRERILLLVRMMAADGTAACQLPCFGANPDLTLQDLHDRFFPRMSEEAAIEKAVELIDSSINNWRDVQYDRFQRITNDIR